MTRRVEHHLDNALDPAVRLSQTGGIQAKTARDRRTDLLGVQLLAFDFARLDDIFGESPQDSLLTEIEAERLHPADQPALLMPDSSQGP